MQDYSFKQMLEERDTFIVNRDNAWVAEKIVQGFGCVYALCHWTLMWHEAFTCDTEAGNNQRLHIVKELVKEIFALFRRDMELEASWMVSGLTIRCMVKSGSIESRLCSKAMSFRAHICFVYLYGLEPSTESRLWRRELDLSLNAEWVKGRYIRDCLLFYKSGKIAESCRAKRASWKRENSNESNCNCHGAQIIPIILLTSLLRKIHSLKLSLSNALYFHLSNLFNAGSVIRDHFLVLDGIWDEGVLFPFSFNFCKQRFIHFCQHIQKKSTGFEGSLTSLQHTSGLVPDL